jgi:hypothetical protein
LLFDFIYLEGHDEAAQHASTTQEDCKRITDFFFAPFFFFFWFSEKARKKKPKNRKTEKARKKPKKPVKSPKKTSVFRTVFIFLLQ